LYYEGIFKLRHVCDLDWYLEFPEENQEQDLY